MKGEFAMQSMPKVSVITSCYNGEKYIERWKNAILNQTYDNIEVLVINDGSTDKSGEMLALIAKEYQVPSPGGGGVRLFNIFLNRIRGSARLSV